MIPIEKWRQLFKAPFVYESGGTRIADTNGNSVVDIRGWGVITYEENPEQIQDAFGEFLAKLLNAHLSDTAIPLPTEGEKQ